MPQRIRTLWLLVGLGTLHLAVGAVTKDEEAYLGGYTSRSVDAQSQLMLLDDNTFCFRFMGGSLDMLAAGRWQALPDKTGVRLQEVRQPQSLFMAFTQPGMGKSVVFDFHGYTLSEASAPVFGVSASDAWPSSLRPLFSTEDHSWAESYPLPPIPVATARYFYMGQVETDAKGKAQQLRVSQFELPTNLKTGGRVRVVFNTAHARPALNMVGSLRDGRFMVDDQYFGTRDELPTEVVSEIRAACISPVLHGTARPMPVHSEEDAPPEATPTLVARKTTVLPLSRVKGSAWFPAPKS